MKAIDHFMLISFGFIFAALIEYILVLNTPMSFKETFPTIKRMFSRPKELEVRCNISDLKKKKKRSRYIVIHTKARAFAFASRGDEADFHRV